MGRRRSWQDAPGLRSPPRPPTSGAGALVADALLRVHLFLPAADVVAFASTGRGLWVRGSKLDCLHAWLIVWPLAPAMPPSPPQP
jgi:hypothetical protein